MKLSTKSKYAIVALLDIIESGSDRIISLGAISVRQNLPMSYLEQIFLKLRRNSIVESVRGSNGGYLLTKPYKSITLYDVVIAVDDLNITIPCTGISSGCAPKGARCLTHQLFTSIDIVLLDFLKTITLKDVFEKTFYEAILNIDKTFESNSEKEENCVYHTA